MTKDWYKSFDELAAAEVKGQHYDVVVTDRKSSVLIMAPHGGAIEPGTSEISSAIAGSNYSFYLFEGLVRGRKHHELHINSTLFDEPQALEIARNSEKLVAIHGRGDGNDCQNIWLGGRDTELGSRIKCSLIANEFQVIQCSGKLAGKSRNNICNRCSSNMGVQLEIPRKLRKRLLADTTAFNNFAAAVRSALLENQAHLSPRYVPPKDI